MTFLQSLIEGLPAGLSGDLPAGLQVLRYGLPALLGYVLYVGIAGRFGPGLPTVAARRPAWLLGLWTGLCVAVASGTAMHVAHGLPVERAGALFGSAARWLGAALLPGWIAGLAWGASLRRSRVRDAESLVDEVDGIDAYDGIDRDGPVVLPAHAAAPVPAFEPEPVVAVRDAPAEALARRDEDGGVDAVPGGLVAATDARRALDDERRLREETEKHLQVTRRALYSLDAAARDGEDARADALIALETELEAHVHRSSAAEARAAREESGRVRAETNASRLKHEVLRLRSERRRAAEARARAVATAGKSVAFARRSMQARAALEERLRETTEALANRQETISSLIRALETEKGRTEEQVASRAEQLVLHERQLRERRSLEQVARSVEGKLSTRLVKKVARARPLVGT